MIRPVTVALDIPFIVIVFFISINRLRDRPFHELSGDLVVKLDLHLGECLLERVDKAEFLFLCACSERGTGERTSDDRALRLSADSAERVDELLALAFDTFDLALDDVLADPLHVPRRRVDVPFITSDLFRRRHF